MKIYTRTGDDGDTALFGGGRVAKDHERVEACGSVDELNAVVGWCASQVTDAAIGQRLETLQHDLFAIGSELATPPSREGRTRPDTPPLPEARIGEMERWIDEADAELDRLTAFILPGGAPGAAALHVARTVCRRAERAAVRLGGHQPLDGVVIKYLNRLSDLLFTFARLENYRVGAGDLEWRKPDSSE